MRVTWFSLAVAVTLTALTGCGGFQPGTKPVSVATAPQTAARSVADAEADADIAAARAKLTPEDRALVEAQEWCVISSDERLGSMGPPIKLDVKGQAVYVCCGGCKKRAEAGGDKTLAKVEELKAKKREQTASQTR